MPQRKRCLAIEENRWFSCFKVYMKVRAVVVKQSLMSGDLSQHRGQIKRHQQKDIEIGDHRDGFVGAIPFFEHV